MNAIFRPHFFYSFGEICRKLNFYLLNRILYATAHYRSDYKVKKVGLS